MSDFFPNWSNVHVSNLPSLYYDGTLGSVEMALDECSISVATQELYVRDHKDKKSTVDTPEVKFTNLNFVYV